MIFDRQDLTLLNEANSKEIEYGRRALILLGRIRKAKAAGVDWYPIVDDDIPAFLDEYIAWNLDMQRRLLEAADDN